MEDGHLRQRDKYGLERLVQMAILEAHESLRICSRCGYSSFGIITPLSDNEPMQLICICCSKREPLVGN
jgi:hypothetical protein